MTLLANKPSRADGSPLRAGLSKLSTLPKLPKLPRAPKQRSTAAIFIGWIGAVLALLTTWFVAYALVISSLQAGHDQQVLYAKFREQLSEQVAPVGGAIKPSSPVALLSMSSIGLRDEVVVEGTASGDLENGPGHVRSSVLPGQQGVAVIYGRAQLFGGPFAGLAKVRVGSTITMLTGQGTSKYVVNDVRRAGDPYPVLPANGGQLTLVTAEGAGWRNGWASNHAVYVDARLTTKTFPVPAGRPATVPTAEKALQGDPSALQTLILWLPLLGFAVGAVVWTQERWGRWQTWLLGLPIVLACLWGVSQTAIRLMPNLL